MQERCFKRCSGENFQITASDFGVGIFRSDDLTLLGNANGAVYRATRLRQNRIIAWAAAATDRAAAAMEQAHRDAVFAEDIDELNFGLIELPARGNKTAIFVAVRIAEHDFLHVATVFDQSAIGRVREGRFHNGSAGLQIADGFKERDDIDVGRTVCGQQAHFFQKNSQF